MANFKQVTGIAKAAILSNINTFMTSDLPAADRWTSIALPSSLGFLFISNGTSAYNFPLQFTTSYGPSGNENYLTLETAAVIDTGRKADNSTTCNNLLNDDAVVNGAAGLVNPSFESVTSGSPDGWTLSANPGGAFTMTSTPDPTTGDSRDAFYKEAFFGNRAVILRSQDSAGTDEALLYTDVTPAAGTTHNLSFYVKPSRGVTLSSSNVKIYARAATTLTTPYFSGSFVTSPTVAAVTDGWYRVSADVTLTASSTNRIGIVFKQAVKTVIVDGAQLTVGAGLHPFTLRTSGTDTTGTLLRKGKANQRVYFSTDGSGTASTVNLHMKGDFNSFSIALGNTVDDTYNSGFYGRLITPSGDPVDSSNTNGADVTAIAIGTSSNNADEGRIYVYQNANGQYWEPYEVFEDTVGSFSNWGGGRVSKFNGHATGKQWMDYLKPLFIRDMFWKDRVNLLGVASTSDGYRGHLPDFFTLKDVHSVIAYNDADPYKKSGVIYYSPNLKIMSGTADASGNATTLNFAAGGFTAGVRAGDVVYHEGLRVYVKVTAVGSNTQLTTATLGSGTWNAARFKIFRGISFSIFKVGFAPGTQVNQTNGTSPALASKNNFTPHNGLKRFPWRKTAIILAE